MVDFSDLSSGEEFPEDTMITSPDKIDCSEIKSAIKQLCNQDKREVTAAEIAEQMESSVGPRALGLALTYGMCSGDTPEQMYEVQRSDSSSNDYKLICR